jgi:predicted permease
VVRADDTIGTDSDLFVPIDEGSASFLDRTGPTFYYAIGRLRPDVDVEVAQSQVAALSARRAELDASKASHVIETDTYREFFTPNNWRPMYFFLGASLVVLLLGAVNVASLLLGRAFRRRREFALRGALGGGVGALARQLLVEGAVLAVPGCVAGLLVTTWALALFSAELPAQSLARASGIPVDYRVWAFAFGVTAVTTALFVLMPLAVARRINLSGSLGPGSRTSGRAGEGRARLVLLTAQMALTVILLSGAGLFLKSFAGLMRVPIGFEVDDRLAMRASLGGPAYQSGAQIRQYADELLARARATPGLGDVAVASSSPLGSGPMVNFVASGAPEPAPGEAPRAIIRTVSPGYFRTLGIALERGREFSASDVDGAPRVAVVNEYLAREMFGDADPVGQVITLLPNARTPWTRQPGDLLVVGVAGNAKEIGIDEVAFKDIYVPFAQMPSPWVELVARANVPVASFAGQLRQSAAAIDLTIPVSAITTFEQRLAGALQEDRFNTLLVSSFAGVALLLASIGIYGAVAYAVQARTRELGVRLALGARPSRLVGGVLWNAGRLGVIGGVVGLVATLAIARVMGDALYLVPGEHNGLLYGVSTTDPAMLASALAGMVLVALVAGAIPARRVGRVDPVLALRNE